MISLELSHIKAAYRRSGGKKQATPVLNNIDLKVAAGDTIGITGLSGAGKTTLGLVMCGLLKPDKGTVRIHGTDFWASNRQKKKEMGVRIQMVFQHPESAFDPRWTIEQSLAEPFRLNGTRPGYSVLTGILNDIGLDEALLDRRPHQLSGGELQRIAIARVMAMKPDVVVLDEPTAMLDVLTQARIISLLERYRKKNNTGYVLVSHDAGLVKRFCRTTFLLSDGQLHST